MPVSILGAAIMLATAPLEAGDLPPETPTVAASPTADASTPATAAAAPPPSAAVPGPALPAATPPATDPSEIVVSAEAPHIPGDPLQAVNLTTFKATQAVDRAVIRPTAIAYRDVVPEPVRSGVRNFLNNLTEPVVFVNFLLQLKVGKAAETLSRFAVNTTVGAAGLMDVAKRTPFKLPYRVNGFAYTLGYYGVKPGPFLFLPLVGPTTVRDLVGVVLDRLLVPLTFGRPFNKPAYALPSAVFGQLDQRAQLDAKLDALHNKSGRPYGATREDYLAKRQSEIDALRGNGPPVETGAPPVVKDDPK